jgi:hypothetical protein
MLHNVPAPASLKDPRSMFKRIGALVKWRGSGKADLKPVPDIIAPMARVRGTCSSGAKAASRISDSASSPSVHESLVKRSLQPKATRSRAAYSAASRQALAV